MLILDLVINDLAKEKLAARGISAVEIKQVLANVPAVADNPEPRMPGGKVLVGPTDAARFLTVVLQPDEDSATRWHVMTGWESSPRQINGYQRRRWWRMIERMDHEPTSDDVDRMLEANPNALERLAPNPDVRVHIEVALDSVTLRLLDERATREGRPLADVVSDVVRDGVAAA